MMRQDIKGYTCPILKARFVLIPAGTFMMGSPEDEQKALVDDYEFLRENGMGGTETLHKVTISEPFYLQTMPVTQQQWKMIDD